MPMMYTILRDDDGVFLKCQGCPHIERVNQYDEHLGSRRTQAARAMHKHVRDGHVVESVPHPGYTKMERW